MVSSKKYSDNPYLNNSLSPSEFFNERAKSDKMYPKEVGQPQPISFWEKNSRYYGLLDQRKNFIVPDPAYLKQIKDDKNKNVFVLDFVADAFRDFELYMNLNLRSKLVEDESVFKKRVQVSAAWKDYTEIQAQLEEQNYNTFVTQVLGNKNRHAEIQNIEDFMELFFNFYVSNLVDRVPFTTEGLMDPERQVSALRLGMKTKLMDTICLESISTMLTLRHTL